MQLFHSIFGGGEELGRYPESLVPLDLTPREDFVTAAERYLSVG